VNFTIRKYYELTTLLLLALTFILTGSSGTVSPFFLVPSFVFAVFLLRPFGMRSFFGAGAGIVFAVLSSALGVARYWSEGDIVLVFAHVTLGLIPQFLPKHDKFSGYWMSLIAIVVLSLIDLLSGESLSEFLFFIALASTLVFSLNAAHLYFYVGNTESRVRRMPPHYFAPFIGSAALGLVVGVLLFVFFPRSLSWQNPLGMRQKSGSTTGYSGGISLGATSINESQELAMSLESRSTEWFQNVFPFILIRGNVLDTFDGEKWSNRNKSVIPYSGVGSIRSSAMYDKKFIRMRIYREPHDTRAIFIPGVVQDASFPRDLVEPLSVDENGNLRRESSNPIRYAYDLTISPTKRPEILSTLTLKELSSALVHPEKLRYTFSRNKAHFQRFLDVPTEVSNAPYFKKWMQEVYKPLPQDPIGIAFLRLASHFRDNYRVGYEAQKNNVDSLESFVDKARYGHCEYFATASVLFLRTIGIPARIVLGYRGGGYNEVSQVLEVREANAHAWVEAYIPHQGWLSFDPTPVTIRPTHPSLASALVLYFAAAKFWLQRYLVDYDSDTQAKLFKELRTSTYFVSQTSVSSSFLGRHRVWLFAVCAILVALGLIVWNRKPWRDGAALPGYYREFEKAIKRAGFERHPTETFSQFHHRLKSTHRFSATLEDLDQALEQDLYASQRTLSQQQRALKEAVRQKRVWR
jgi:hypothetical protein